MTNPAWDISWASNLFDRHIDDESDAVTMERFKRFLRTASEDGGQFDRAITIIDGLKVKLDTSFDKIEATLDK